MARFDKRLWHGGRCGVQPRDWFRAEPETKNVGSVTANPRRVIKSRPPRSLTFALPSRAASRRGLLPQRVRPSTSRAVPPRGTVFSPRADRLDSRHRSKISLYNRPAAPAAVTTAPGLSDRVGHGPRLAIFLGQQFVGFGIVDELLGFQVKMRDPAGAVGNLAQNGATRTRGGPHRREQSAAYGT